MNQKQQQQSMFANISNQQQQILNQKQQLSFQNFNQIPLQSSPNLPILTQPTFTNYNFLENLLNYTDFSIRLMVIQDFIQWNVVIQLQTICFSGVPEIKFFYILLQPQQQFYAQCNLQPSLFGMSNTENYHQLIINYQDDDMIQPNKDNLKQTVKYDLNVNLQFEIKPLYKKVKLLPNKAQYLPGIVSIKAQDKIITQNSENQRVGVDLICLIDISGSMDGQKITMVKQTQSLLLDLLSDYCRYQLITFESSTQRLTPLKRVKYANTQYCKQIIKLKKISKQKITRYFKVHFQQE